MLNVVGHQWRSQVGVGQIADFYYEIKYKPEKLNIDADTLSCYPLHINVYMRQCSKRLSEGTVCATREGCKTAQQGEMTWVGTSHLNNRLTEKPFPVTEHNYLASEQA